MPPPDMNKPLDAITGASPRAVSWGGMFPSGGEGFAKGARVEFLSSTGAPYPGIKHGGLRLSSVQPHVRIPAFVISYSLMKWRPKAQWMCASQIQMVLRRRLGDF